jgi:hypothetical protein
MRIDRNAQSLPLTPDQRFFASCWFNMIHEHSLDSHRVRTMNPRNILRELLRMYGLQHPNDEDRTMVRAEALPILSVDPVLRHASFIETTRILIVLLTPDNKGKLPDEALIQHVARELLQAIETSYLEVSLTQLAEILLSPTPAGTAQERQALLAAFTSGLLSTLIDGGASVESLFQLYNQILVPRKPQRQYIFARKFGLLTTILKQPPKTFRVLFSADNVTDSKDFPQSMGGISFSNEANGWEAGSSAVVKTYLAPHSRRLFAELTIEARDIRAAGTEAYAKIGNVLDLARFEYERERVTLSEEFLIAEIERPDRVHRYSIPKVVPNPAANIEMPQLEAFVSSVNELLSSDRFSQEGRDRVLSAFRLYRLGSDTNSFENKLTNWWTAVEFLVRGLKGGKKIGAAVEHNLTPVLCLSYPAKLLIDIRQTLQKIGAEIVHPATSLPIDFRRLDLPELFKVLTGAQIRPLVSAALASEPYLQYRIGKILDALSDPLSYHATLKEHEQRIRWQIQRLWRARCDIVHSARRPVSDVLLCANLEFYLKIALMSLLAELRRIKTLGSPEEFFERRAYSYKRLKEDIEKKSTSVLESTLVAEGPEPAS